MRQILAALEISSKILKSLFIAYCLSFHDKASMWISLSACRLLSQFKVKSSVIIKRGLGTLPTFFSFTSHDFLPKYKEKFIQMIESSWMSVNRTMIVCKYESINYAVKF